MGALTKLMLSDIAIGAEHLESIGPPIVAQEAVKIASPLSDLSSVLGSFAFDVINGQKSPIGLSAAYALTAVGGHDLPAELMATRRPLGQAGGAMFSRLQFLLTAIPAQTRRCQLISMTFLGGSIDFAALAAQFCRSVARFATIGATGFTHDPLIVSNDGGYVK